jgi:hypothetical protein
MSPASMSRSPSRPTRRDRRLPASLAPETGKFVNGKWIPGRKMNGDDVVLDYDQAAAAANNQSGSGLMFGGDGPTIQWVKLYRYQ